MVVKNLLYHLSISFSTNMRFNELITTSAKFDTEVSLGMKMVLPQNIVWFFVFANMVVSIQLGYYRPRKGNDTEIQRIKWRTDANYKLAPFVVCRFLSFSSSKCLPYAL